jgi:hypothetical protein
MRPGLKTGLRLPTFKKIAPSGSKLLFLDSCNTPSLPIAVKTGGTRWNYDPTRLARIGESGGSNYRLLLGTARRGYLIQVRYEIKKGNKPLRFSLFSADNQLFQELSLKHYLLHQSDDRLIWYRTDNSVIKNFGNNNNSLNTRFLLDVYSFVEEENNPKVINSISLQKLYPAITNPSVFANPNVTINPNDYLYFEIQTQESGHLLNKISIEVF